jgi:hypothetical protein
MPKDEQKVLVWFATGGGGVASWSRAKHFHGVTYWAEIAPPKEKAGSGNRAVDARCDRCNHWAAQGVMKLPGCNRVHQAVHTDPVVSGAAGIDVDDCGAGAAAYLITAPDFGCSLFEPKEGA